MLTKLKAHISRRATWGFAAAGAAGLAIVLVTCIRVWSPIYGLTRFIPIGTVFVQRGIAPFRDAPKYVDPNVRWGFDGQLYAELSLDPLLRNPGLKTALDDPPYRAHRIFLSWLAWAGGLGRPFWVLNVYAALNPIFWLGYVVILYFLFRRHGWPGVAGFAAMLLTCGVVESIYRTLTDFPAFVLMTLAAMIGGYGGAGAMALSALTREVNVAGVAALFRFKPPWGRTIARNLLLGLIAAVPLGLWFAYVAWRLPMRDAMVGGNLDWPFHAIAQRLGECFASFRAHGFDWRQLYREPTEPHALLTIVAILTQCLYLALHPRWENRLWRLGAIYIALFVCLSANIWGGFAYFTVTRHALPITLAFNLLLAMRPTRRWLVWFVLGNCFVPAGVNELVAFGARAARPLEYTVAAPAPLARRFEVAYADGWSGPEWDRRNAWHWSTAERASLVLSNRTGRPLEARLDFRGSSLVERDLRLAVGGRTVWVGTLPAHERPVAVDTLKFPLPPGDTAVEFSTEKPPVRPGSTDPRRLSFRVARLVVTPGPAP